MARKKQNKKFGKWDNFKLYSGLAWDVMKDLVPRKPLRGALTVAPFVLGGGLAAPVLANNVTIENSIEANESTDAEFQKTRLKANLGPATFTYDRNYNNEDPDEAKVWVNIPSRKNLNLGFLVEGETDSQRPYMDLRAFVGKRIGSQDYEVFVGPTVQDKEKPIMFYQVAVRDTTGKKNLVMALIDDRAVPLNLDNLDFRAYVSGETGNSFGGIGANQKGLLKKLKKVFGAGGFKNQNLGSITVFKYDTEDEKLWFKSMNAVGNPGGVFNVGIVNIWNDMQGLDMRNVELPYFTSFLTKGDLTGKIEGSISPESKDYELMVGKDLGLIGLGTGVNYHREEGRTNYGALFHAVKDINLGKFGKGVVEAKYNSREKQFKMFGRYQTNF